MYMTVFHVNSITYAMRGKSILEKNGIRAKIERSADKTDRQGCGYSLIVWGQGDQARGLLTQNGIPIRKITGSDKL